MVLIKCGFKTGASALLASISSMEPVANAPQALNMSLTLNPVCVSVEKIKFGSELTVCVLRDTTGLENNVLNVILDTSMMHN